EKIIESLGKRKNSTVIFQFKSAYKGTDIVIKAQTNDKEELSKIFAEHQFGTNTVIIGRHQTLA
ncbi:hypothetical protein KAS24_03565, partial [Candidatus Bathyarchaeota archaeon]|nr:hypothetical protein [Candidatus Bathyarchaeota archaeon]